ncbi:unnamed protein product [Phytomonas sp. Hart1]|nr:unnamed protein product [Phytomonas sp. Hart1]|eukprot:CCW68363.1 unnamed protein product [Phytomonas sp. isolate Hart1]
MSNSIFLLRSGAPAGLMEAAAMLITQATGGAITPVFVKVAERNAVVVGVDPPSGAYASVVRPPDNPNPTYAGVQTVVVRSILPREPPQHLQLRDILDVYLGSGIDGASEAKRAGSTFTKAAKLAVEFAKEQTASRLTLVIKTATKYENLNNVFVRCATEVAESAGLTTEVLHTAKAANELVIFPEKYGVVLVNDNPICENVQRAFAGVVGGAPEIFYLDGGDCISGGASYRSIALAVAQELVSLGMPQEAEKVRAAAAKDTRKVVL